VAFKRISGIFYPTVGLHSPGETIIANFGQKPFKFDIEGMISEQQEKMMTQLNEIPIHVGDVHSLIRNYLLHYGFEETLQSFESAGGTTSENSMLFKSLQNRKRIRQLIMDGETEKAVQLINQLYPGLLGTYSGANFLLQCQHFIECIKKRKDRRSHSLCSRSSSSIFTFYKRKNNS